MRPFYNKLIENLFSSPLFLVLFFFSFPAAQPSALAQDSISGVSCEEREFIERLELSKEHIQALEFQKALDILKDLENCSETFKSIPVIDLVLYLKGEAEMAISSQDARKTYERLLELCSLKSCSPLLQKKSRSRLIELLLVDNYEKAIRELEGYVELYPEDDQANYLLAYLKEKEGKEATGIYKNLFLKNSSLTKYFRDRITPDMLSHEELEDKIKGLIRLLRYDEAERIIKERLRNEKDQLRIESLRRLLGNIYFKQKRYIEAAEEFFSSKEYYFLALSYLRSGADDKAKEVIDKLINARDRRVVPVAIAYARTLRDKGYHGASIEYLGRLLKYFPFESEQIHWAMAWTYYRTGNYEEAKRILGLLEEQYKKPRYIYWLLRVKEKSNQQHETDSAEKSTSEEILSNYRKLMNSDSGFYSLLARHRMEKIKLLAKDIVIGKDDLMQKTYNSDSLDSHAISRPFLPDYNEFKTLEPLYRRFSVFTKLGLKDELSEEIGALLKDCIKGTSPWEIPVVLPEISSSSGNTKILKTSASFIKGDCREVLKVAGFHYFNAGQYSRAVALYSRLKSFPDMQDIDERFLYPFVYPELILKVSRFHGIDPYLLLSIIREESRYNPEAISPAGAIGLMQIMPYTAERLIKTGALGNISNKTNHLLYNPEFNIQLGASYLKRLLEQYKEIPVAIAAYNAGESAVDSWLRKGYSSMDEFIEDIPYGETMNYVKRVLTTYERYLRIYEAQR